VSPETLARRYLLAMESRDIDAAQACLAPGATFVFPGGRRPPDLAAIVARSAGRYRRVAKRIERVDLLPAAGFDIVYVLGTLHGEWIDGSPFENVRFLDRFEIREGRIVRQDVWNDTGEARAALFADGTDKRE
jgi:ketosteroid isomerase-like protein